MVALSRDRESRPRAWVQRARSALAVLAVAVVCVLVAAGFRWALHLYLGDRYTILFFLLAVVMAAYLSCTRAALLTAVLSWAVALWFFVAPHYSFLPLPAVEIIGSIVFWIIAVSIALVAGRMRLLQRRAEQRAAERSDEVRRLAEQLQLSDRLSLIGTLTAGVGHDLGNMLMPMRARIDLLDSQLRQAGVTSDDVEKLRASAEYLGALAKSLSHFVADPSASCRGSTNLAGWWETVRPLHWAAVPSFVKLECSIGPDVPPVGIAPHSLSQVTFNAIQNAGKAMSGRGHGRIEVTAEYDPAGHVVHLFVRDDGPGMPGEQLQRIGVARLETSGRRAAAGIGLPLMRSILESVGGSLAIASEEGRGTELRLDLPVAAAAGPTGEPRRAALTLPRPHV